MEELKIDNDKATKEMLEKNEYKYGFVTDVQQDIIPKGISEEVIHFISNKKNEPEWLLNFRLKIECLILAIKYLQKQI